MNVCLSNMYGSRIVPGKNIIYLAAATLLSSGRHLIYVAVATYYLAADTYYLAAAT